MVKKAILVGLFFILSAPVFAETIKCTTDKGWVGVCTESSGCSRSKAGIEWDKKTSVCQALSDDKTTYGCCGSEIRSLTGTPCTTTREGWTGVCTIKSDCSRVKEGIAWDNKATVCQSLSDDVTTYGCCGADDSFVGAKAAQICNIADDKAAKCEECMADETAVWTALGCIKTDPEDFIGQILGIGVGIGGGIAFLLILFGGFQILTSAGNPEKLNAGKELVTSAITGLLIIIFSIFILRLIGVNMFGIPDFT